MKRLRLLAVAGAAFVGGIVFVVACGDDLMHVIDAGAADASCASCEAPITPERIYQVTSSETAVAGLPSQYGQVAVAACASGDILLGGGCRVQERGSMSFSAMNDGRNPFLAFGPTPEGTGIGGLYNQGPNGYTCVADEGPGNPVDVIATAICFKPAR